MAALLPKDVVKGVFAMKGRKWEHKVLCWNGSIAGFATGNLEALLNNYGEQGWELVNIVPEADAGAGVYILLFKREVM